MSDPEKYDGPTWGFPREVSPRVLACYRAAFEARGLEPSSRFHGQRRVESRAALRDVLREAGIARAAAERIASAGWPALSPENEAAAALERIRAATNSLRGK